MTDVGTSARTSQPTRPLALTTAEREWLTVAVENELAARGKLMAEHPEFHAVVIAHLTAVYDRLRNDS